ncbi:putative aldehyde:ferredoxin oxidoreductase ['Chrysanthemum coronarium' phytoplasma]|uniref:Aldehyde:ferredoxin oxidoreductase n=1 Tax='Chrysanthemum coronarium' phytoplasma TaxID=1520703 RepID=A0ABQ0J3S8_9MOLU|nr:putative aldehyde:ferredoxin oxidoreductase ['Chrysanthemum coronarium' phytoplasma]
MNEGGIGPYGPVVTTSLFHGENEGSSPSGGIPRLKEWDFLSSDLYLPSPYIRLLRRDFLFYIKCYVIFDLK